MVPILHPLPLDLTGYAPTNVVVNDKYDVMEYANDPYKIIVLDKGYFYTHDLEVYDQNRRLLKIDSDYQVIAIQPEIASLTAFTACAIIVITNPVVTTHVYVTARMVGGEYCLLTDAIIRYAETLAAGGARKVYWRNIKDKPSAYKPSGHLQSYWSLYGFTDPTITIKRMVAAQKIKTDKVFDSLYNEWKVQFNSVATNLDAIEAQLTAHIQDTLDPHVVTKAQIGLEQVYNGSPATDDEARLSSGIAMYSYATPYHTKLAIEHNFLPMLNQHINDFNNPHGVTYQTLGTYSAYELQQLTNLYYPRGSTVEVSNAWRGLSMDTMKQQVRDAIPISEIKSGIFPWSMWTNATPKPDSFFVPSLGGYGDWLEIKPLFAGHTVKGNDILYLPGNFRYPEVYAYYLSPSRSWYGPMSTVVAQSLGVDYKPGTMVVFRWTGYWSNGAGKGTLQWTTPGITMMVLQGGRWIAPGFDGFPAADATPPAA